ncbi:hypothetical protein IKP94_03245 [Candidatus Saccharibacteria bacterium]|nr:hypothetical protein [Candidatus Saccharibacteria bacterium]
MNILGYFLGLYQEKKQVALLAWAYGLVAVAVTILAGLVALINQSVGVAIMIVPLIAVVAFSVNVVMWALIRFAIESAGVRAVEKRLAPFKKIGHEVVTVAEKVEAEPTKKTTKKSTKKQSRK